MEENEGPECFGKNYTIEPLFFKNCILTQSYLFIFQFVPYVITF